MTRDETISYEASTSYQSYKIGEAGSSKHKHGPEHGSQKWQEQHELSARNQLLTTKKGNE